MVIVNVVVVCIMKLFLYILAVVTVRVRRRDVHCYTVVTTTPCSAKNYIAKCCAVNTYFDGIQ